MSNPLEWREFKINWKIKNLKRYYFIDNSGNDRFMVKITCGISKKGPFKIEIGM
jgi:hypothetical protein